MIKYCVSQTNQEPIQLKVNNEVNISKNYNQSIERCKEIIRKVEAITKRRTIAYFAASVDSPAAFINDNDSIQIEDLLRIPNEYSGLDLILNTGGGIATSAERIINVCKTYVEKSSLAEFRVIVPKLAKSAATMVSLGADKILLCDNAELGPIDPQLILTGNNGLKFSKPSYLVFNAVKELFDKSNSIFGAKNEKYLTFLRQYNYDIFMSAKNELGLSRDIAGKILNRKKKKYSELKFDDFSIFTDPTKTLSHGRLIGIDELRNTLLCTSGFIENIGEHFLKKGKDRLEKLKIDELSKLIWELLIRKIMLLNDPGNPQVKTIEDSNFIFISTDPEWKSPVVQPQQQPQQ